MMIGLLSCKPSHNDKITTMFVTNKDYLSHRYKKKMIYEYYVGDDYHSYFVDFSTYSNIKMNDYNTFKYKYYKTK